MQLRLPPRPSGARPLHINVLEARAIMLSIRKIAKQGVQNSRIVVCVGFASVRRSVLEGQVFLEETERRHSTRGGPCCSGAGARWMSSGFRPGPTPRMRLLEVRAWRSGVPRCLLRPRLSFFGAAHQKSTVTCGDRILGPSEAFVGKPGVMKRFFPLTEPELFKSGRVPGPRWPPPRYAVLDFPETGVEPQVPYRLAYRCSA